MPAGRAIVEVVQATKFGPGWRLVGTVDVDGNGTNHPLDQVDPFILLDHAIVTKDNTPGFGAHPHRGHSVITVLLNGKIKSWDSYTLKETIIQGPASYWVDAGSGVFHDEKAVIANEDDPEQHPLLFQLWVGVAEEDRLQQAAVQYEENLPIVDAKNAKGEIVGSIRYHVGGGGSIRTPHPVVVAHIHQNPGTTHCFPIDPRHGGFLIDMSGNLSLEGRTKPPQRLEVLVLAESTVEGGDFLEIATDQAPAEYLVCVGEKVQEQWYKKLVASGAVIAKSPEEAREIASKVEVYAADGKAGGSFAPFGA